MTSPTRKRRIGSALSNLHPTARAAVLAGTTVVLVAALVAGVVFGGKTVKDFLGPFFGNTKIPFLENTRALCADFKDAAGLYKGNKVLLLGVEIGTVTGVINKTDHVQVDFTIPADTDLPIDVGAASYTQSLITNRSVELSKPYIDGAKFTGDHCISRENTRTPVGVSESFAALSKLADTIMEAPPGTNPKDAPGVKAMNESLKAAAYSLKDTGAPFREMLQNLTIMVGDPLKANSDWRQLFENSSTVTNNWLEYWPMFATLVRTIPTTARLVAGLSNNFGVALDGLASLLPTIVGMVQRSSGRIYKNLTDKLIPWIRDILNAYTPAILSFFSTLPPGANWLADDFYLPNMKTHNVTYIPPRVAISPEQASAICQNLRDRNTPGAQQACAPGTASDPVTLGLTNLIMGGALS